MTTVVSEDPLDHCETGSTTCHLASLRSLFDVDGDMTTSGVLWWVSSALYTTALEVSERASSASVQ